MGEGGKFSVHEATFGSEVPVTERVSKNDGMSKVRVRVYTSIG